MNQNSSVSSQQLAEQLIEAYMQEKQGARVDDLRQQLYQRGYNRSDIVELALVSILRSRRNR
jgi:hypothetical protein